MSDQAKFVISRTIFSHNQKTKHGNKEINEITPVQKSAYP